LGAKHASIVRREGKQLSVPHPGNMNQQTWRRLFLSSGSKAALINLILLKSNFQRFEFKRRFTVKDSFVNPGSWRSFLSLSFFEIFAFRFEKNLIETDTGAIRIMGDMELRL
jgi:hypothetical protein